jgi:DNA-binding MarR family transcriptional regulator
VMGMVERVPDPKDGRTKRIRYSRRGHAALMHGLDALRQLEESLTSDVGAGRMRELNRTLTLLVQALEKLGPPSA